MSNFFEKVKDWFESVADWVQENLGDPGIAAALRDDLGLQSGEDIPKAQRDQISQFADGFDPDKKAFMETVNQLVDIITALVQLGEQISDDSVSGWDVAYIMGRIAASESIRIHAPLLYAIGKATLFVSSEPENVTALDPSILVAIANGDAEAMGSGEAFLQRLTGGIALLVTILESVLEAALGPGFLDSYYGWDSAPDSPTPNADLVSSRAMTFIIKSQGDIAGKLAMTLLGVPPEHSGPALFVSLGGGISATQTIASTEYKLDAGVASGLNLFIPFSDAAHDFDVSGDPSGYVKLSVLNKGEANEPAFRIGEADKTRLDVGGIGFGIDIMPDAAGFRFFVKEGALIVKLGEGDGLLQSLSAGEISLGFDMGLTVDTAGGVRIDGGTMLRATIPVDKTLGGFLNIHHVDLMMGPSSGDYDVALEMSTAFGVSLGPFQASVDRIGFKFEFAFREGNLGFMDVDLGFKPPNGVGMVLDAGIVKGGGYLFLDHQKGEYAGALELKFASWGLKAIGILSTKMPDGSSGFALLLLIYADLPRFHIAFGIFFEGVGGIIGLQHGVDIAALQEGIPTGVFDDVLFPANPVGDAPRIINRLRVIFPIRQYAFLIGPMFRLTWGTPAVGEIKLGLVLAMDNVLGGDSSVSLSSIVLMGQIRIGMPETQRGDVIRIICDFMGYLDFDNKRFGFYARLRDSRLIKVLEITGSLVLQIDFGDQPSFVLAVGGFHPRFEDLPAGLPSKLDRVGLKFKIAIVKITIKFYFAVTSATVQFGAEVRVEVKLGPVKVEGWLGFDALIYYQPYFRFEFDFRAGMTIKVFDKTLMGIQVEGLLSGPGEWHISGKFKFSILFWDFEKSFDERWGDRPEIAATTSDVAALMQAAYSNPDNWSAALPMGADTLVTLSAIKGETGVLAHPLGQLRVTQKVAPLGVSLEKYGENRVQGANRFDLTEVRVGSTVINNPQMTKEYLSRGDYIKLNEEDRLTKPSFESFDVGVAFGSADYVTPEGAATEGDLSYETRYLVPGMGEADGVLLVAVLAHKFVSETMLSVHARMGPAAQSKLRANDKLISTNVTKVILDEPELAVVNDTDLGAEGTLRGDAVSNRTLAEQQFADEFSETALIVEFFELR